MMDGWWENSAMQLKKYDNNPHVDENDDDDQEAKIEIKID